MSIEQYTNPFQPHIESKSLSSKEVTKYATNLLDSFEEYMKKMELRKKPFTEYRSSNGWEWQVEFNPGEIKNNRSLYIDRREANSDAPFARIMIDKYNITSRVPQVTKKGTPYETRSRNNYDVIAQATEFVENFIHSSETESH